MQRATRRARASWRPLPRASNIEVVVGAPLVRKEGPAQHCLGAEELEEIRGHVRDRDLLRLIDAGQAEDVVEDGDPGLERLRLFSPGDAAAARTS